LRRNMKKIDENAIIQRIKQLRSQYAGNRGQSEFARALNISPSSYNYYEKKRVPRVEVLLKICEVTGADLVWLLTGCEAKEKFASGPDYSAAGEIDSSLLRKIDVLLGKNPELAEPISAFVELLCQRKQAEKEFATRLSSARTGSERVAKEPHRPGWIPLLGRTAAGVAHFWGTETLPKSKTAVTELDELVKKHLGKSIIDSAEAAVSVDLQARAVVGGLKKVKANLVQVGGQGPEEIVEFVECKEISELFADSFALHIDGDSMSPRINDGDVVILSPSVPAADGQVAIVHFANQIGVTCKLIRTTKEGVHLIPINERYETKVIAEKDLLWALAVLCHISV